MSLFKRRLSSATTKSSSDSYKHTFCIYESRNNSSQRTLLYFIINEQNGDLRIKKYPENKNKKGSLNNLSSTNLKYVNNIKNISIMIESIELNESHSVRLIIQFNNVLNIGVNKKTKRGKYWDILFKSQQNRSQCISLIHRISIKLWTTKLMIKQEKMKRPNQWISDDKVKKCQQCQDNFNAVNRKHHCRNCGKVFCNSCSSQTAVLPQLGIRDIVRVCDNCYKFIILNRMKSDGLLSNDELYRLYRTNVDYDNIDEYDRYYSGINDEWRKFIAHYYGDKLDPFNDDLRDLIRNGIPSLCRGYIWKNMVDFNNLRDFRNDHNVITYDDEDENKDNNMDKDKDKDEEDIYLTMEKDLQRTFPIHKTYKMERSIGLLRNVLRRYAVRNPEIGYCQSMNFLGGILLLFLNENDAFWMLSYLIEKICCLFDEYFYHQTDILGVKIDGFVFNDIIKEYLPELYQHLVNIDGTDNKSNSNFNAINNLTFHWFLSLFINTLSYKSLLRIWDNMICYDNINIIFRAGLTILKLKSNEILKCKEFFEVHDILSNKNILNDIKIQIDTNTFIKICLNNSEYKDIDNFILKQRIYHKNKLTDDYIGSQMYNDLEINLISEYADYNRASESFIQRAKTTLTGDDTTFCFDPELSQTNDGSRSYNENEPNSWIIYNQKKYSNILPVNVQTFTSDTPRRSLSNINSHITGINLPSKQDSDDYYSNKKPLNKKRKSSEKNLNENTSKYYFQSDAEDNNDEDDIDMNNKPLYELFKSSPSITRAPKNTDNKTPYRSKSEALHTNNDDDMITHNNGIFESQLMISKSYHHRDLKNKRAWSLDDDVILVASPNQKNMTLFHDDYVHINANRTNS